jgi:hypothetical protein
MKCGSLNLLEPSGPHQACYGTPLPLYIYLMNWEFLGACLFLELGSCVCGYIPGMSMSVVLSGCIEIIDLGSVAVWAPVVFHEWKLFFTQIYAIPSTCAWRKSSCGGYRKWGHKFERWAVGFFHTTLPLLILPWQSSASGRTAGWWSATHIMPLTLHQLTSVSSVKWKTPQLYNIKDIK